ncbi:MAG: hypothetical protein ACYCSN_15455 [Acidobacteriaceae bacterium]
MATEKYVYEYGPLWAFVTVEKDLYAACRKAGMTRAQALWYIMQHAVRFDLDET